MPDKALAPGSVILLTGVNGYIAGHVAAQLLDLGYKIRGTVRDDAKLAIVEKAFAKYPGQFEGVVIADMRSEDAFAHLAKGVDGVIHMASDLSFGHDPNLIIPQMIKATENALSASDKERSIKRFVLTSSTVAATASEGGEGTINVDSWNTIDVEKAWAPPPYTPDRAIACYAASKVGVEQAAWRFVEEKKPHFVLNTVLPSLCLGPKVFEGQNLSTAGWLNGLNDGDQHWTNFLRTFPLSWNVDVRDVARLHIDALLDTDVQSQRILAAAEMGDYGDFTTILSEIDPKHAAFPEPLEKEVKEHDLIDSSLGEKLLRRDGRPGFIGLRETLRAQFLV